MREIYERVSIRKFTEQKVEDEKILQILRAAMQAPSAGDQQPWEFIVVRDKELLQKLAAVSKYAGPIAGADVAIVNVMNTEGCMFPEVAPVDMSICTEHEWLEATTLGIGGVWLGVSPFLDRITMANELLGVKSGKSVFSIMALGYPAQERTQKDRFHEERIQWR